MKKLYVTILLLLCGLAALAQDFEIASVEFLEHSMQAVNNKVTEPGNTCRDCALLRIATQNLTAKQQDSFDFGTDMGSRIEKRASRDGEIWLWVTPGLRYLIIKGVGLGGSRELAFDNYKINIQSLKTYKITIRGTAKITDDDSKTTPTKQFLAFEVTPKNATLEVDGEVWTLDATGGASQYLDVGVTYKYRVRATDYFTEEGTVTIDDPYNTKIVPIRLRPNTVTVTLRVDADAEIWIDNQYKGKRTWTGRLGCRAYMVECRQANHETSTTTQEITVALDGQTIILPAPKPLYGSLVVSSNPILCKLYIDGHEMGTTPRTVNEVLIGQHEIKLTKEGYADYTETVTLAKGETKQVSATLEEGSKGEETFTVGGVTFTMKLVEGGTFQMGATYEQGDDALLDNAKPVHSVTLGDYYMGETEVTQALWQAVMGSNPAYIEGDNLPVVNVSWNDCQVFISKLNQKTGRKFRLPTEAEWEYAARGGKKSKGYKYSGGSNISEVAWYMGNSGNCSRPVKLKYPNELGLYDMTGNVWEWCYDWYGSDYYRKSPSTNPQGPLTGSERVVRGGSANYTSRYCRVSARDSFGPLHGGGIFGFRLALSQ